MNRRDQERLAAEFVEDAADDAAWEADPGPHEVSPHPQLGAQVTIRLEPELADELCRIAQQRKVQYTVLVRHWLVERLLGAG